MLQLLLTLLRRCNELGGCLRRPSSCQSLLQRLRVVTSSKALMPLHLLRMLQGASPAATARPRSKSPLRGRRLHPAMAPRLPLRQRRLQALSSPIHLRPALRAWSSMLASAAT
jgi:hypothetical protein